METRVAVISIIVEQEDAIEELNILLHEARQYIVGRMGLKHLINQFGCLLSTGTMCHRYCFIFHDVFSFFLMNTDNMQSRLPHQTPCRRRSDAAVYSLFRILYNRMVCISPEVHRRSGRPDLVFLQFSASDI